MLIHEPLLNSLEGVRNPQDECQVESCHVMSSNPQCRADQPYNKAVSVCPEPAPSSCADVMLVEDRIVLLALFL